MWSQGLHADRLAAELPFGATDALLLGDSECPVTGVQTAAAWRVEGEGCRKVFQGEGTATAN